MAKSVETYDSTLNKLYAADDVLADVLINAKTFVDLCRALEALAGAAGVAFHRAKGNAYIDEYNALEALYCTVSAIASRAIASRALATSFEARAAYDAQRVLAANYAEAARDARDAVTAVRAFRGDFSAARAARAAVTLTKAEAEAAEAEKARLRADAIVAKGAAILAAILAARDLAAREAFTRSRDFVCDRKPCNTCDACASRKAIRADARVARDTVTRNYIKDFSSIREEVVACADRADRAAICASAAINNVERAFHASARAFHASACSSAVITADAVEAVDEIYSKAKALIEKV